MSFAQKYYYAYCTLENLKKKKMLATVTQARPTPSFVRIYSPTATLKHELYPKIQVLATALARA